MTKEDMQTLRILFGQGLTDNEIAEKMCYSPLTILFYRRELGLKRKRGGKRIVTEQVLAQMHELHDQGLSYERIANVLNISRYTVGDYLTGKVKV
ncbi:MAG: hypothetical protein IKD66_00675 [Solobacterium sp.]|nr:hypothetical protein [Solobacterium sp.]